MTSSKSGDAFFSRALPRKPCRLPLNSSARAKRRAESSAEINPFPSASSALHWRDEKPSHRFARANPIRSARAVAGNRFARNASDFFTSNAGACLEPQHLVRWRMREREGGGPPPPFFSKQNKQFGSSPRAAGEGDHASEARESVFAKHGGGSTPHPISKGSNGNPHQMRGELCSPVGRG
jgi:hypothetical protein